MLACFASQDSSSGVPVIAGGNDQRIHLLIIQNPTKVNNSLGYSVADFAHFLNTSLSSPPVNVTDVKHLGVWLLFKSPGQRQTATESHDSYGHSFVGS
jgi:hypothetical protein